MSVKCMVSSFQPCHGGSSDVVSICSRLLRVRKAFALQPVVVVDRSLHVPHRMPNTTIGPTTTTPGCPRLHWDLATLCIKSVCTSILAQFLLQPADQEHRPIHDLKGHGTLAHTFRARADELCSSGILTHLSFSSLTTEAHPFFFRISGMSMRRCTRSHASPKNCVVRIPTGLAGMAPLVHISCMPLRAFPMCCRDLLLQPHMLRRSSSMVSFLEVHSQSP